ncbi:MAG: hypothetical protein Q8942_16505 [Bacillota bacterium]|nr:hypothetical protein [Bacillota bacterium]
MYLIWGAFTALLTIFLEFIFLQGSFSLHNFNPGLFIPAGGWIDGLLCASGIYLYMKIKRKRVKIRHRLCSVIIAIVTFSLIYFMMYFSAYVSDGNINHSFKGEHISNYMYNKTEVYSFRNYLKSILENTTTITTVNGLVTSKDNLGFGFNKFMLMLELLGFCVGGLTCGVIAMEGRDYCRRCKTDFMRKRLYSFKDGFLPEEIEGVKNSFESKESFKQFIKRDQAIEKDIPYYEATLKYCLSCKTAYIEYRYIYSKKSKDNKVIFREDKDKYEVIEAPYIII